MITFFQLPQPSQPDSARLSLFPLEPRGMGTGQLESLSSYISRLANEHWMLCTALLRHLSNQSPKGSSSFSRRDCSINGLNTSAAQIVSNIEAASSIRGLRNLTLLPLRHACDPMGKLSAHLNMQWCSQCWRSDVATGQSPYIRLLWAIQSVDICAHHECALSVLCPSCSAPQQGLPSIPRCWLCQSCGEELYRERKPRRLNVKGHAQRYWTARAAEALIERTCARDSELEEGCLAKALAGLVDVYSVESAALFSKQANIPQKYVTNWLLGKARPVLPALFDLCYRINIPPDQFLLGNGVLTVPGQWRSGSTSKFLVVEKLKAAKKAVIARELKSIINDNPEPPTPVSVIAKQFAITFTQLRYHFENEYTIIQARASAWRSKIATQERQIRLERAIAGIQALVNEGIFPSERQLRDRKYVRPSDLRRVEIIEVLREVQARVRNLPLCVKGHAGIDPTTPQTQQLNIEI